MNLARLIAMLILSVAVSVPIVWLVPRARQSVFFDRLLWLASGVMAFLAQWFALGLLTNGNLRGLGFEPTPDVPVAPLLASAAAGALALNLSLWIIDQVAARLGGEEPEGDEEAES